eukprot:372599_1
MSTFTGDINSVDARQYNNSYIDNSNTINNNYTLNTSEPTTTKAHIINHFLDTHFDQMKMDTNFPVLIDIIGVQAPTTNSTFNEKRALLFQSLANVTMSRFRDINRSFSRNRRKSRCILNENNNINNQSQQHMSQINNRKRRGVPLMNNDHKSIEQPQKRQKINNNNAIAMNNINTARPMNMNRKPNKPPSHSHHSSHTQQSYNNMNMNVNTQSNKHIKSQSQSKSNQFKGSRPSPSTPTYPISPYINNKQIQKTQISGGYNNYNMNGNMQRGGYNNMNMNMNMNMNVSNNNNNNKYECIINASTDAIMSNGSNNTTAAKVNDNDNNNNIPSFQSHMSLEEANRLRINDKIDHRNQVGRFVSATLSEKQGTNVRIHYDALGCDSDSWSDFNLEIHRFAVAGSISKRAAHRFSSLSKGDYVDINPRGHPGWKCGEIRKLDETSGQVQVEYESLDNNYLYWAHLDDFNEIAEFTSTQMEILKKNEPQQQN